MCPCCSISWLKQVIYESVKRLDRKGIGKTKGTNICLYSNDAPYIQLINGHIYNTNRRPYSKHTQINVDQWAENLSPWQELFCAFYINLDGKSFNPP